MLAICRARSSNCQVSLAALSDEATVPEQLCRCRYCSRLFPTFALCRAHEYRQHPQHHVPATGLVFCRHTHTHMVWTPCPLVACAIGLSGCNLAKHITKPQCPVLTGHCAPVTAAPPGLAPQAGTSTVTQVSPQPDLLQLDTIMPDTQITLPAESPSDMVSTPAQPAILPLVQRLEVQELLRRSHWHALLSLPLMRAELTHHCPFCRRGAWISLPSSAT